MLLRRGDIWLCRTGKKYNKHTQEGTRPVLILSNWKFLDTSSVVNCIPLTSKDKLTNGSAHVKINKKFRVDENTIALCEQITTIDKANLVHFIARVTEDVLIEVQSALNTQLGFKPIKKEILDYLKYNINELERWYGALCKNPKNNEIIRNMRETIREVQKFSRDNNLEVDLNKYICLLKKIFLGSDINGERAI